jgi:hypothetical protein
MSGKGAPNPWQPTKKLKCAGTPPPTKKYMAGMLKPTREMLRSDLAAYDNGQYPIPLRDKMEAVTVQAHHRMIFDHFTKTNEPPTPNTKLFLESAQKLIDVRPESIVQNWGGMLCQIGNIYLGQRKSRPPTALEVKPSIPIFGKPLRIIGSEMFGGSSQQTALDRGLGQPHG